jgi:hypothetical protein
MMITLWVPPGVGGGGSYKICLQIYDLGPINVESSQYETNYLNTFNHWY